MSIILCQSVEHCLLEKGFRRKIKITIYKDQYKEGVIRKILDKSFSVVTKAYSQRYSIVSDEKME